MIWLNNERVKAYTQVGYYRDLSNDCQSSFEQQIRIFNESQIQASNVIKELQTVDVDGNFEDCLNMYIPDSFLRVYRGEGSSNED